MEIINVLFLGIILIVVIGIIYLTAVNISNKRSKKISEYNEIIRKLPEVSDTLSDEQIERVLRYVKNHPVAVNSLLKEANLPFEVSETEDKNDPRLWKPGHWLWFFTTKK